MRDFVGFVQKSCRYRLVGASKSCCAAWRFGGLLHEEFARFSKRASLAHENPGDKGDPLLVKLLEVSSECLDFQDHYTSSRKHTCLMFLLRSTGYPVGRLFLTFIR